MDCAVVYWGLLWQFLQQITAFIARDNLEVAERFANRLVDLAESLRFRGPATQKPAVAVALAKEDGEGGWSVVHGLANGYSFTTSIRRTTPNLGNRPGPI